VLASLHDSFMHCFCLLDESYETTNQPIDQNPLA